MVRHPIRAAGLELRDGSGRANQDLWGKVSFLHAPTRQKGIFYKKKSRLAGGSSHGRPRWSGGRRRACYLGTTQQWERKINNPKFSTPLSLFGFPLCLVFPKPQGRSVWVAPRRAGWTDRRSLPPLRTPGPGPSLGTGPGKPARSKPLQSSREGASERAGVASDSP